MTAQVLALDLARQLISYNTVNPPGREASCARHIGRMLEHAGLETRFYEFAKERTSLVARKPGKGRRPPICFTGHMDTVPLGEAPWHADPFGGDIDGDRVYGRGASDMKGALAAMVSAVLRVAREPEGDAALTLVLTAGEETGSAGARHLTGLDGALGSAGALVVGEPTGNYPYVGHKGALWLEGFTSGVSAHGSMPENGVNAVYKAARAVTALEGFRFDVPAHPVLGAPTLNVGTISGGVAINSVPDRACVGIDIRTVPNQDLQEIMNRLQSVLGNDIEFQEIIALESVATDPQDPWVQGVFELVQPLLQEKPVPKGASYFTDASFLTPAFGYPPTVLLGPGEPEMAHRTDEFCYISKIEAAAGLYVDIAKNWCGL